ncbi:aspartate/methionine/tyrosine aminotransferase [Caballeronia udeis]|uniref:Aminotransferase n=1 Tax=Caballeronia udeis TaxID=1232866 RepID=A0ABW8ML62_9BURK
MKKFFNLATTMNLHPFKLERIMSEWQNHVQCDLSSSGVDAVHLEELVSAEEILELRSSTKIRFVQTNGPVELRDAILRRYPTADRDNVLVTNGSSEALMVLLWHLCTPGYEIVEISPTYSLVAGLARTFGATVKQVELSEKNGWSLDTVALDQVITPGTQAIYVCNPNNPTGSILTDAEMHAIAAAAKRVGALLIADEIYHGAELDGVPTKTFLGMYDNTVVTSSLSKAYGLAGLRLGWMVGPKALVAKVWTYHDYTTTTATALSVRLAEIALEPTREKRLFDRAIGIAHRNIEILDKWVADNSDIVSGTRTKVGGLAFIRYHIGAESEALALELIKSQGLLVGPGSYFGQENHFRIGYSVPHLEDGLKRLAAGLRAKASE